MQALCTSYLLTTAPPYPREPSQPDSFPHPGMVRHEDKKNWRKSPHTTQKVYERLVEKHGYTESYSIVHRHMKKCRSIQTKKANLELIYDPRSAQVDFREADLMNQNFSPVSCPLSLPGVLLQSLFRIGERLCKELRYVKNSSSIQ